MSKVDSDKDISGKEVSNKEIPDKENSDKAVSNKIIPMEILGEIIKEQLNHGGRVRFTPKGVSMLPMLRDNEDVVLLEKPKRKLKKYDLPLYQRADGKYILHRVVDVLADGTYVMCGDNQVILEYGIADEHIVGVVSEFERKGKKYSVVDKTYCAYCRCWVALLSVRRVCRRGRVYLGKVKRKLGRIKDKNEG